MAPAAIVWDVDPAIFRIGAREIRWYGLLFALAIYLGYRFFERVFREEKLPPTLLDKLALYLIIGIVVGARLGHVLFYDWPYYRAHPAEIVKVWHGGLASHGGAVGIIIALWLFARKYGRAHPQISLLWLLDRMVIPTALGGALIRLGNLMNSEIIGKPAGVPWAFVFKRVDDLPRHPTQLYEAIAYLAVFFILRRLYHRPSWRRAPGRLLGAFLVMVFGMRFVIEFFKEWQEGFTHGMPINMGQMLSIPFVAAGAYFLFRKPGRD